MNSLTSWIRKHIEKHGLVAVAAVALGASVVGGGLGGSAYAVWQKWCRDIYPSAKNECHIYASDEKDDQKHKQEKHDKEGKERRGHNLVGGGELKPFEGSKSDVIFEVDYRISCRNVPYSISVTSTTQQVDHPPTPLPAYCGAATTCTGSYCTPPTAPAPAKPDASSTTLNSVGALKVRYKGANSSEFWASGFMISENVFATSCHALEGFLTKDGILKKDTDVDFLVSFSPDDKTYTSPANYEFSANYEGCSKQVGLDVALFTLKGDDKHPVPAQLTLFFGELSHLEADNSVLIGYADLRHPLDKVTSEMYECFADPDSCYAKPTPSPTTGSCNPGPNSCYPSPSPTPNPAPSPSQKPTAKPTPKPTPVPVPTPTYGAYGKFAMVDKPLKVARCKGVDFLLDIPDTTVGSSGSVVMKTFVNESGAKVGPLAVGIHKCCAAFFGNEDYSASPDPSLSCAVLRRTPFNQEVTTNAILKDPTLCAVLQPKVKVVNEKGEQVKLTCP